MISPHNLFIDTFIKTATRNGIKNENEARQKAYSLYNEYKTDITNHKAAQALGEYYAKEWVNNGDNPQDIAKTRRIFI